MYFVSLKCYKMAIYASPWIKKMERSWNLGSRSGYYKEYCLMGCNAVYFGRTAYCLHFAGFLWFSLTLKMEAICSFGTLVDFY
jgi:hypothetical protein